MTLYERKNDKNVYIFIKVSAVCMQGANLIIYINNNLWYFKISYISLSAYSICRPIDFFTLDCSRLHNGP